MGRGAPTAPQQNLRRLLLSVLACTYYTYQWKPNSQFHVLRICQGASECTAADVPVQVGMLMHTKLLPSHLLSRHVPWDGTLSRSASATQQARLKGTVQSALQLPAVVRYVQQRSVTSVGVLMTGLRHTCMEVLLVPVAGSASRRQR